MKRIVSAVSLLAIAIALALGWHFRLHEQLLEHLQPAKAARAKPEAKAPVRKLTPAPVEGFAEKAVFQLAVYYLPRPTHPSRPALQRLLPRFPSLRLGGKGAADEQANVQIVEIPVDKYVPPSVNSLHYFGRGLSTEQAEALQKSEEVLVLDFRYRPSEGFTVLREAQELALVLARETGGLLWDEESREVFTPEAWKERRLDPWTGPLPHVPSQYVIHLYRSDELLRAISLGLGRFGLPDLVVESFPASSSDSVEALINLTAQTLVEKGRLDSPGHLRVSVPGLKNERLAKSLVASYQEKATGIADLTLVLGTKEEGDPDNRLLEIEFPATGDTSRLEAQNALLASLFGATDHLTRVKHDDELLEASRKAKAEFPRLAALTRKGYAPGERLLLKAPFTTDDGGNEWMWVEVVTWKGDVVDGILQNDPYEVSDLKAGARVTFRASDAFDYIHYHPDGREEGNGTGKILRRREGKPEPRADGSDESAPSGR